MRSDNQKYNVPQKKLNSFLNHVAADIYAYQHLNIKTLPVVRPRSHPIVWERVANFALTGFIYMPEEKIYDGDHFIYRLLFNQKNRHSLIEPSTQNMNFTDSFSSPKSLTLWVYCPYIQLLWDKGAKDLVSHFFPNCCSLESYSNHIAHFTSLVMTPTADFIPIGNHHSGYIPSIITDQPNRQGSLELLSPFDSENCSPCSTIRKKNILSQNNESILRIDIDASTFSGNVTESESLGQRVGYIRFFLLTGPIFKHLRRAFYGYGISDSKIIWDRRLNLTDEYYHVNHLFSKEVQELFMSASQGVCLKSKFKDRRLLTVARQIGHKLRFSCTNNIPHDDVAVWCANQNEPLPSQGQFFSMNFLRLPTMSETELLSIAKLVAGLRQFLYLSFRHRQSYLNLEVKNSALRIAKFGQISSKVSTLTFKPSNDLYN